MQLVAGIDSSTQSCKVVIINAATGTIVREGRASHPEGTEINPEYWWDALQVAISNAGGLNDVSAVSIGGQQHGCIALNSEGKVIRDALLWNDTRSAQEATTLTEEIGAETYAQLCGVVPVASFTATKLRWIRDNEPDKAKDIAAVALPHDWLSWRLAGYGPEEDSPKGPRLDKLFTDASDASGTGYYSAETGEYNYDLLEKALGHRPLLPRIVNPGEIADYTPENVVIAGGCGDNAGAALGLGATLGDVVISIGTSGTVFALSNNASHDPSGTVAGFASASGEYLPLIATLNAARILDNTAKILDVSHEELGELALSAEPGSKGLVLHPYYEGERTPNLPDAKAKLHGMTLKSMTRNNLARASIEGLLCGLADGLEAILAQGVDAKRILIVGGAAQNSAVQVIASEVFDIKIVIPEPGEYVARGAALQAAWALNQVKPEWEVKIIASPQSNYHQIIRKQYKEYQNI